MSVSASSVCAVYTGTLALFCWGTGNSGNIGDGFSVNRYYPIEVTGSRQWQAVFAATSFSCGIQTPGSSMWCWVSFRMPACLLCLGRWLIIMQAPWQSTLPFSARFAAPSGSCRNTAHLRCVQSLTSPTVVHAGNQQQRPTWHWQHVPDAGPHCGRSRLHLGCTSGWRRERAELHVCHQDKQVALVRTQPCSCPTWNSGQAVALQVINPPPSPQVLGK